ncbi:LysE family translocator [Maricaulis sp. CAU 1757]
MPDLSILASFALAVLVLELTPGPNMAWLAVLSASEGRRAGLAATFGVALGLLFIGGVAALGLSALISRSDFAFQALRWAGTLFLLWLAWQGWQDEGENSPARLGQGSIRHFRHGFVINALNPKAGVFYVAVLPDFMTGPGPLASQAALLTVISVAIATAIHLSIVTLAGTASAWVGDPHRRRRARRVLSLLLVLIAVWLFFTTGRLPQG